MPRNMVKNYDEVDFIKNMKIMVNNDFSFFEWKTWARKIHVKNMKR